MALHIKSNVTHSLDYLPCGDNSLKNKAVSSALKVSASSYSDNIFDTADQSINPDYQ